MGAVPAMTVDIMGATPKSLAAVLLLSLIGIVYASLCRAAEARS